MRKPDPDYLSIKNKEIILELKSISKRFPGVKALDNVSFQVEKGEVHALVGENGAGKSTLMKILGGLYKPSSGSVIFNHKEEQFKNAHQSQSSGISVVYQEFNLFPDLTVAENIFVGREPRKGLFLDWRSLKKETAEILNKLDVSINSMALVFSLTVAEKQMVEIAKALNINSELIIMDEPTASLSDQETQKLLDIILSLKKSGKTILFVSHRLQDIFAVSDNITILRDGTYITTRATSKIDKTELVHFMVGKKVKQITSKGSSKKNDVILEVKNGSVPDVLYDINFLLYQGEILGISGLMGSGRTELAEVLYGLARFQTGNILLNNKPVFFKNVKHAINNGIGLLSEDRKTAGLFHNMSVQHNLTMTLLHKLTRLSGLVINSSSEGESFDTYKNRLDIRCQSRKQEIKFLSGGNQQKVLLGRVMLMKSNVLILCEPTRGIDIGAKAEIHDLINKIAQSGAAIIMISSDLPEIISMSDRCLVMHEGRISAALDNTEITERKIMKYATGHIQ